MQEYSFLTTSLKLAKTEHIYFSVRNKSRYLNAIACMLFDASSCSMFNFQCSIFDCAIFILLFCMLNLHWLGRPKFVNDHRRNCTKKSEFQNVVRLLVIMYTKPILLSIWLSLLSIFVKHKLWEVESIPHFIFHC